MLRAVGGEFELDPALLRDSGAPAWEGCFFSSGRAALSGILAAVALAAEKPVRVLLPRWICESVIATVDDARLPLGFYPLADALLPDVDAIAADVAVHADATTVVVAVDYFGLAGVEPALTALRDACPDAVLVRDDVQALFEAGSATVADYRFTSFRKSLPAPDGALAEALGGPFPQPEFDRAPAWALEKALAGVLKHFSATQEDEHVYLDFAEHAEEELDHEGYYDAPMSEVSRRVLGNVDLAEAARARRANFAALEALLGPLGVPPMLPMTGDAVPLAYPVLLEERDSVRRFLAENRIFAPAHWPLPAAHRAELDASDPLWTAELSLPIDQRYGDAEMARIADALGRCGARALHH